MRRSYSSIEITLVRLRLSSDGFVTKRQGLSIGSLKLISPVARSSRKTLKRLEMTVCSLLMVAKLILRFVTTWLPTALPFSFWPKHPFFHCQRVAAAFDRHSLYRRISFTLTS